MELHLHDDIEDKIYQHLEDEEDADILSGFLMDILKKNARSKAELSDAIEDLVEEEMSHEV